MAGPSRGSLSRRVKEIRTGPSGRPPRSEFRSSPRTRAASAVRSLARGPAAGTSRPTAPRCASGSKSSSSRPGTTTTGIRCCARASSPTIAASAARSPRIASARMIANGTRGLLALGRYEALRSMALAAVPAALLIALTPTGGDAAAHLYRTLLVREGVFVWDNLWFAGQYPLASYSLLYYLPAALVGN